MLPAHWGISQGYVRAHRGRRVGWGSTAAPGAAGAKSTCWEDGWAIPSRLGGKQGLSHVGDPGPGQGPLAGRGEEPAEPLLSLLTQDLPSLFQFTFLLRS